MDHNIQKYLYDLSFNSLLININIILLLEKKFNEI